MAHLLENINGHAMAYNNKNGAPWHQLGTPVDGLMTADEAIVKANLDWTVSKQPVSTEFGVIPNTFALMRDNDKKVMGISSDRYTIVQNRDAFGFFDELVGGGYAMYETAGALQNGTIWLLAKMPQHMEIVKGDIVTSYVLLSNSHNGKLSVQGAITPVRVVCNNTLTLALAGNKQKFSIRHTTNVASRTMEAMTSLGIINKVTHRVEETFKAMAQKQVGTEKMRQYISAVFNAESTQGKTAIDEVFRLVEVGAGSDIQGVRGTVWGVYNAVTEKINHFTDTRKGTDELESLWFGRKSQLNAKAFSEALVMLS